MRFFPTTATVGRWLASSPLSLPASEVRIVARKLESGRVEFGLQQRQADDAWGERLLPRVRFFPTTATVGRWLASSPLTLAAPPVEEAAAMGFPAHPDWTTTIAADYPHMHQVGLARVYSDISAEFSRDHAVVLDKVFRFFSRLYSRSRGPVIEAYYTLEPEVFKKVVEHCPTIFIPGARNLTACYGDIARWFIMPYSVPDFGTLYHEIGHDFLFATFPESAAFPWFMEGTAMYYEGGEFDTSGDLVVAEPHSYCTILYGRSADAGTLIPLGSLLRTPKQEFLADNERTYSQSCMFVHYLVNEHPGVLEGLVASINGREFASNDDLLAALMALTGLDTDDLEAGLRRYAGG